MFDQVDGIGGASAAALRTGKIGGIAGQAHPLRTTDDSLSFPVRTRSFRLREGPKGR
jgi:hypothetical protein